MWRPVRSPCTISDTVAWHSATHILIIDALCLHVRIHIGLNQPPHPLLPSRRSLISVLGFILAVAVEKSPRKTSQGAKVNGSTLIDFFSSIYMLHDPTKINTIHILLQSCWLKISKLWVDWNEWKMKELNLRATYVNLSVFATKSSRWIIVWTKIVYRWESQTPNNLWSDFSIGSPRLEVISHHHSLLER